MSEHRERFVGQQLNLSADVRSIEECREIYTPVSGRLPRRFPMPVRLFERFAPDTAACGDEQGQVDRLSLTSGGEWSVVRVLALE